MSLYEQIGGDPVLSPAIDLFHQNLFADERINYFFCGLNQQQQSQRFKAFITFAFGGPKNFTGSGMRATHKRLSEIGINDGHFDLFIKHFGAALREHSVPTPLVLEATAILETVRDDVLGK